MDWKITLHVTLTVYYYRFLKTISSTGGVFLSFADAVKTKIDFFTVKKAIILHSIVFYNFTNIIKQRKDYTIKIHWKEIFLKNI